MVDNSTSKSRAVVPAMRADFPRTPWFVGNPTVMLKRSAQSLGLPLHRGGMIYTGVSRDDSQQVLAALSSVGINPENAEVHREISIIPDAALVGSAVGLCLLLLLTAWSGTRAQVQSMRLWASRLTQLGVKLRWARMVIWKQYLWILAVALPLGVAAGTLPLFVTGMAIPRLPLVVPWWPISVLLASVLAAVLLACALATRSLTSSEALGWRDGGE